MQAVIMPSWTSNLCLVSGRQSLGAGREGCTVSRTNCQCRRLDVVVSCAYNEFVRGNAQVTSSFGIDCQLITVRTMQHEPTLERYVRYRVMRS